MKRILISGRAGSERGNIAVILGLSLTTLLTVMALALNTGHLMNEKNRYQNAADAAALAGAIRLCSADPQESARQIFLENLLPNDPLLDDFDVTEDLEVQVGFYDVFDEYAPFTEYTDFIEKEQMPLEQWENAVMVRLRARTRSPVSGMLNVGDDEGKTAVGAAAVAYLRRYDMVSLKEEDDEDGNDSKLWANGFSNGDIRVNGDIVYPKKYTPALENATLNAHGKVYSCPTSGSNVPQWDKKKAVYAASGIKAGASVISDIVPCDEGYVNTLKPMADVVYEPGQQGNDEVFFGFCSGGAYMSGGASPIVVNRAYLFDISESPEERITYFFDATTDPDANVVLTTGAYNRNQCEGVSHFPRGDRISNVTFIANCPILVFSPGNVGVSLRVGNEGDRQAIFISSDDIILHNSSSSIAIPKGVTFRCGGNFYVRGYFWSVSYGYDVDMRVIADGIIDYDSNSGMHNLFFGPPCPPTIPKLGRLEPVPLNG